MKRQICCFVRLFLLLGAVAAQKKVVKLKIVQTSDIRGDYYSHNFILQQDATGSLARVYASIQKERETYKNNLILLGNGDILQGQSMAYYRSYIDTASPHLTTEVLNYMGCDAGNMSNHDVETGHTIFDRWTDDCHASVLGADVIDTATDKNRLPPYVTLEHDGVEIVVLGMITPAIPMQLSENPWEGLRFDDMETTAHKWMEVIRERERSDVVMGIFHTGQDALLMGGKYRESASLDIARNVPGFDTVLMGHDHARERREVQDVAGNSVLVMDPVSNDVVMSSIDLTVTLHNGKVVDKQIDGVLTEAGDYDISEDFMKHFASQYATIQNFVSKKVRHLMEIISARPAYFGSSVFVDLIHTLQLNVSSADISLAVPLSYDIRIEEGDVYVYDMFDLYRCENVLYTMRLSDKEIYDVLEMSYALRTSHTASPDDHALLFRGRPREGTADRAFLKDLSFNFDLAVGIAYIVDVTKPEGQEVAIHSMADGTPSDVDKMYTVTLNSYRGNGGEELLTKGAGTPQNRLKERITRSTDKDLRYYLMQYMERKKVIGLCALGQWRFVLEGWAAPASERDYEFFFGKVQKQFTSLQPEQSKQDNKGVRGLRRTTCTLCLLVLFVTYQASMIALTHVRYVNGVLVTRSHPFHNQHSHPATSPIVIGLLSHFGSDKPDCCKMSHPIHALLQVPENATDTPIVKGEACRVISLRAPPCFVTL